MKMEIIFSKKNEKNTSAIILLKDDRGENMDGSVAVVFEGKDRETIFVPKEDHNWSDPVYHSASDNVVTRIEKGIYQASGDFSFEITKVRVYAKTKEGTITRETTIPH